MWLYHKLLIHFPVDGNLDHFQFFCYYKYTVHIIVNFLWMYAFVILSILQGRELLTYKQGIQPPWCTWNYHPHFSKESPSLEALQFSSVQFSCSVVFDSLRPHEPHGLPVHHQLPEFTETHVHWVGDAIQPSHLLSSPSPPAFNISQHQGQFQWVSSLHPVAKVLEFQLQHQSFQWIFRTDLL